MSIDLVLMILFAEYVTFTWIRTRKNVFCCTHGPNLQSLTKLVGTFVLKGALDKYNIIPQLFSKKVRIYISLEVLVWVMNVCGILRSRLTYFWNMNITSISSFFKVNFNKYTILVYISIWDTLEKMLFTQYLIKRKSCQNQLKISALV